MVTKTWAAFAQIVRCGSGAGGVGGAEFVGDQGAGVGVAGEDKQPADRAGAVEALFGRAEDLRSGGRQQ